MRPCLAQGACAPWQDTLEKLTGTRQIDAGAISEYFQPLMQWLNEENRGQPCGGRRGYCGGLASSATRTVFTQYSVSAKQEFGIHLCCS